MAAGNLHDNGLSMGTAGWMLSFAQFIGLPASFAVPVVASKLKSQRSIVLALGLCALGGYSGLQIGDSFVVMVISTILIGITLSGTFALALAFWECAHAILGMRQSCLGWHSRSDIHWQPSDRCSLVSV